MAEQKRFGPGERVRYCIDWPPLPEPAYRISRGTCATVVLVPDGPYELYLVRLDTPIEGFIPEMSVSGRYLEPE